MPCCCCGEHTVNPLLMIMMLMMMVTACIICSVFLKCPKVFIFCFCQLQKCSQTFTDLEHKYHALAQSSFDADPATLANITGYSNSLTKFIFFQNLINLPNNYCVTFWHFAVGCVLFIFFVKSRTC